MKPLCRYDVASNLCYSNCPLGSCNSVEICPVITSIEPPSATNSGASILIVNSTFYVNSSLQYQCRFGVGPTFVYTSAVLLSSTSLRCSAPAYSTILTGVTGPYTGDVPFVVTLNQFPYFPIISFYYYRNFFFSLL